MATKKYAGPSPYTFKDATHPDDDYIYAQYMNDITLNHSTKSQAPAVVAAIFGLGRAGSIHLSNILGNPRVILKYIVDDRSERFEDLRQYWHLKEVVFLTSKEAETVYKDDAVNAVFICSTTHTHHEIVVRSLANNKDVFCEKPIAESVEDTRRCYETAQRQGRSLFAAFNRRFDPACRGLRDRVRNGVIGQVQIVKVTGRDCPLPSIEYLKTSGGIFHDYLVHDFDMVCWVLGELPIRVQASASALIPEVAAIDDFDTIAFLLSFPSGAIVVGDNSRYCAYGSDQRLEVFGNKGMVKIENERPCHSTEVTVGQEGAKQTPIFYSFPSRYHLAYKQELEHFLDIVQKGVPMEVTSWQTMAVTKIATLAEQSARTGQTVDIVWTKEDGVPSNYF